jgi:GT2 family glycosyltransferase
VGDAVPKVAALLLNWRQAQLTLRCLQDLLAVQGVALRVLVMDNGSGDGSAGLLAAAVGAAVATGAAVEFLGFDQNLGFCAAMNRGIAWARERGASMVLLLNNDLRLPPDFLLPLVEVLRNDRKVTAVGPTILRPDGRAWAQGGSLGFYPNALRLNGHGRVPAGRDHGPEAVDFLPGACVLFRLEDLEAVGGLDESFFMYWEDVDVCRKLRDRGRSLWLPWVQVVHQGTSSSGGGRSPMRKYMMACNGVRYLRRSGTVAQWAAFLVFDVLLWPLSLFGAGGPRPAFAKARGMLAGLLGRRVGRADVERYLAG